MERKIHRVGDLVITIQATPENVVVDWKGRCTSRVVAEDLVTFMDTLFAAPYNNLSLEVRFDHLEHANSQAIGFITGFIGRLFDRKQTTTIIYDPHRNFQKVLVSALRPLTATHSHVVFNESV